MKFTKIERFYFHHGGPIINTNREWSLNNEILKKGWQLVDFPTLEEIFKTQERFLHRIDGYLLATHPESMEIENPDDSLSDIIIPGILSENETGLNLVPKIRIRNGIVSDHSAIYILAVK